MSLKYALLIFSIIVILFVFYKQYDFGQRWKEGMTEDAEASTKDAEASTKDASASTKDANASTKDATVSLPLREFCVKSCFNSAYDTTFNPNVSTDGLSQRIKEGYRFLDLNVFSASGDVYVGYSPDNAPTMVDGTILLSDALSTISTAALSGSTTFDGSMSNVHKYPVFVHIRVYRKPSPTGDTAVDIVSKVADVINGIAGKPPPYNINYLRNSEGAPQQIDGNTPLSSLMEDGKAGKLIFSMDILNILEIYAPANYQSATTVPPETITAMQSFVNILSGGGTFPAFYKYTEDALIYRTNTLGFSDASITGSLNTNIKNMYIAFPHPNDTQNGTGVTQPDITKFILDRSIQFIPMRVYMKDDSSHNLTKYIALFNTRGTPFVPMANVYMDLKGNS